MPASYRVDLYNKLTYELGKDIRFFFVTEKAIKHKKNIGVFKNHPFIDQSLFYNQSNSFLRLVRLIRDLMVFRPTVLINVGMSPRAIILCIISKILNKKILIWWGGTILSEKKVSHFKKLYRKIVIFLSDGAIFYSKLSFNYFKSLTKREFPFVVIGNNTRDTQKYRNKIIQYKQKQPRKNEINLITVGFQEKRKNTITLLKALKTIKSISLKLLVIGDGEELPHLKSYCQKNNLKNVIFLGSIPINEIPKLYACSDIFIHPSLRDLWPQTYNEAAAAGLPVLISNKSGVLNSYIEKFKDIALFDPNDYEQLAERIEILINGRELRKKMGETALKEALSSDCSSCTSKILYLAFKK
jgi:glycosyltransferase involved in cell wall biosynthesis